MRSGGSQLVLSEQLMCTLDYPTCIRTSRSPPESCSAEEGFRKRCQVGSWAVFAKHWASLRT